MLELTPIQSETSTQPETTIPEYLKNIIKTRYGLITFSFVLFLFVFLTTYPKYLEILLDPAPSKTYSYFFNKIKSPLKVVDISNDTHGSKVAFRLSIPLLARILHIGQSSSGKNIIILYIIQSLLLIPFFVVLLKLIRRFIEDFPTILFVISCSSIYLSKAFFWDYDFWFDGYAFFFLLLGMFFRKKFGIFFFLTIACWTDERAVIALLAVYIFHLLQENDFNLYHLRQIFNKNFLTNNSSAVIYAGIVYAIIRLYISFTFGLYTPYGIVSGVGFELIPFQFKHRLVGLFLTFEGLWIIFFMSVYIMIMHKKILLSLLFIGSMLIHIIVAYSVFDITRSLTYAFPLLISSGIYLAKNLNSAKLNLFILSAFICLVIPTQFLIYFPRQIPWTILSFPEIKTIINAVIISKNL